MANNIGDVNYRDCNNQKYKTRVQTEKSINSLFRRNILTREQANKLLDLYLSGEVSFGDDGLTAEEAQNFSIENYKEIEDNLAGNLPRRTKTAYIIQPNDSPLIIAQKLGFTGDEAKEFAAKLKADAQKSGMYKKWFNVGEMIVLEGDFKDKIDEMKAAGTYITNKNDLQNKYIEENNIRANIGSSNRPQSANSGGGTNEYASNDYYKSISDLNKLEKISEEGFRIVSALIDNPDQSNPAVKEINSENVVYVLLIYNSITGRNLARDLIRNSGGITYTGKKLICEHLEKRAQELGVSGCDDYFDVKNPEDLVKWIDKAQQKIYQAEVKNNQYYGRIIENKKYTTTQKDANNLKANGRKIASELYNQIDGLSKSDKTRALLSKIKPENVAYVVTEYKNLKQNKNHKSLAKDINDEWGLNGLADVKKYICKPLVDQAKNLGLTGIYYGDYLKMNSLAALEQWIDKASQRVIETMNANSAVNDKSTATTQRNGSYTTKTITNKPLYKEAGITKVEERYDSANKLVDTTYYYNNGKVVREYKDAKRGRVRELVKAPVQKTETSPKITEPVPMEIKLPDDANNNAKAFAKALEKNKAALMKELGIDNDTYNKLAKLAMAIAEQETDFGTNEKSTQYRKGKYYAGMLVELGQGSLPGIIAKLGRDWSYGPTQIKFEMQKRDSWIASKFEKFGLENGLQLYDMENSAIATMIVLAQTSRIVKNNSAYQNGIEASRGNVVTVDGWEMQDGTLTKTYNTQPFVNEVTDEDAICYFWNGRGVCVKDGTMEPEALEYTRNIHKYLRKYNIKEDRSVRASAAQASASRQTIKNFTPMDNNGPIGSIVFMPKMYQDNLTNKQYELEILKASLSKNHSISEESKQELIKAVENGEVAFEHGLTKKEADALTQSAVDKLLKHLKRIKTKLEEDGINFADGISSSEASKMSSKWQDTIRQAELDFKREYLNSISPTVSTSSVDPKNVLMTPVDNDMDSSRMHRNDGSRRGFVGFHNDKGVNRANTSSASALLAMHAKNVANRMQTSGYCMTGFRSALKEAGIDTSDLTESKPRASINFFERHPDMFEEVKYINIGGGKSRQLNSTDLPKLPAGYIVVWVPDRSIDSQFASREGHISITNGNGEAYSDETDNLNWGNYTKEGDTGSGKGEHGHFRVFRLTDKWKVDPATGKLKLA